MRRHNHSLLIEARQLLCDRLDVAPPCPENLVGSMATLPLPASLSSPKGPRQTDPLYCRLQDEFRIEIPIIHFGGRRWLRTSAHLHNTLDEYRYLADALEVIARS